MTRITEPQPIIGLVEGQLILCGDTWVPVSLETATSFVEGDRLIALQDRAELLYVPARDRRIVDEAVRRAYDAFTALARVSDEAISSFYTSFADNLANDEIFSRILDANASDVEAARLKNRSTTRLALTPQMRNDMIAGLQMWAHIELAKESLLETVTHKGWAVEKWSSPLGVVGFVFEGRPNVFADATGVLRTGNTVVFRIGSDALNTAKVISELALQPALIASGLPDGAVSLIDSPSHAAGWELFSDTRVALAVARGSGFAVGQLGAVARQAGVAVSLHGTGGAWMIVGQSANPQRLSSTIVNSLDRKVCNTANVVTICESSFQEHSALVLQAASKAGANRGGSAVVHVIDSEFNRYADVSVPGNVRLIAMPLKELATEWEWETEPEFCLVVVEDIQEAINLFNEYSPQFVVSCVSDVDTEMSAVWAQCNAPFVGDGFTRWVDGQYALNRPELGLANWQSGRLLARGGVLSGDGVHTIRLKVVQSDDSLHR